MADLLAMNFPRIVVDQAAIGDLPQLVELLSPESGAPATLADGIKAVLDQPALGCIFVAREQGGILGMATLTITVSTAEGGLVAILDDLVVAPTRRNQGIGSRLLDAVRDYTVAHQLSRITLMPEGLTVSARRFFQKHGFTDSEMVAMHLAFAKSAPLHSPA